MAIAVLRRIETSPTSPNLYKYNADGSRAGLQATTPIVVEATIAETHAKTALVSKHPVEKGSEITDYIRPGVLGLEMEIAFSNQPINCERTDRDGVFAGTPGTRIQAAWDAFLDLIDGVPSHQLLRVTTGLKVYDNMAIESIGTSQSANNPESVVLRVSMVQVRVVESGSAIVKAVNVREGATRNRTQPETDLGKIVTPILLECNDCAVICAICAKRDEQDDNDSDATPVYNVDGTCREAGENAFAGFATPIANGKQTKQGACELAALGVAGQRGITYDRRIYSRAQELDQATPALTDDELDDIFADLGDGVIQ